jgi:hypothetical protein
MRFRVAAAVIIARVLMGPNQLIGQTGRGDDAAVYKAAIDGIVGYMRGKTVVMSSSTSKRVSPSSDMGHMPVVDSSTLSNFNVVNASRNPMRRIEIDSVEIRMVDDSMIDNIPSASINPQTGRSNPDLYWQEFRRRFPEAKGILSVTGIGYSKDGNEALVAVNYGCGGLCGIGRFVTLKRIDRKWIFVGGVTWRY